MNGALIVLGLLVGLQARPAAPVANLLVTVTDQSGAVIPLAAVVVTPAGGGALPPATTSDKGQATIDGLAPGRYTVRAEFAGFDAGTLQDVQLRPGDNRHVIVLRLTGLEESVTVARDAQAAAADPKGSAFRTVLSREEIEALSDDPAEMAQQLIEMAGGNAVLQIDSFIGGTLPPKAQIKSIHIVRDTFAAENHSAESDEVEIITQPGVGALRGGASSRLRGDALNARNAFAPRKGPEQSQIYEGNIGGTIVSHKSSFALNVSSRRSFDTPILLVATPGGTQSGLLGKRPVDSWSMYGLVDYALTKDQTLRVSFDRSSSDSRNLGVGQYDLPERAYARNSSDNELRAQIVGPLGRRLFANTRVQIEWTDSDAQASLEAQTIRVSDAFTTGGAQVSGGRHARNIELASDIDYVKGRHTIRSGVLMDGGRYHSDDQSNYLGTYFFTSNDDFTARRPSTYTRRIGDPFIKYDNLQAAVYVQDDIKVRKGLTLSPGLRYEAQTHLQDYDNFGPRFGFTWAPRKSGRTTLRGSWGIFYRWLSAATYEQTLRVNGFRQKDLIISEPSFPDPGEGGELPAANRYLLSDDLQMARTMRVSAGIDQAITPRVRVNATYSRVRSVDEHRGLNLNAPVNGVRPSHIFANVVQVVSDAELHTDQLATTLTVNFSTPSRATSAPRWNWQRSSVRLNYRLARAENNTDGAFTVPSSGVLATEWGPAAGDIRHRILATLNSTALKDLSLNVAVNATSGTPYMFTTGLDDNGDLIFNDRPAGVSRYSLRAPWQVAWTANLSYAIALGGPPPVNRQEGRGAGDRGGAQATGRYRLVLTGSVTNLTNRTNFGGYTGVQTSPFFRQPTSAAPARRIELGMSLRF